MKANEIQIGDWIHYQADLGKDGVYEKDIQVKSIYGGEINCEVRHYEIISGKRLCSCKPIPLTPEILEKNGFEYKEGEIGMFGVTTAPHYIRADVPFEVFCDGEPFAIWFKEPVDIEYVHQLQHALRLCGISKEIEL